MLGYQSRTTKRYQNLNLSNIEGIYVPLAVVQHDDFYRSYSKSIFLPCPVTMARRNTDADTMSMFGYSILLSALAVSECLRLKCLLKTGRIGSILLLLGSVVSGDMLSVWTQFEKKKSLTAMQATKAEFVARIVGLFIQV